jgi:hypothetical protein
VKGAGLEASHVYKWLYFYQLFCTSIAKRVN